MFLDYLCGGSMFLDYLCGGSMFLDYFCGGSMFLDYLCGGSMFLDSVDYLYMIVCRGSMFLDSGDYLYMIVCRGSMFLDSVDYLYMYSGILNKVMNCLALLCSKSITQNIMPEQNKQNTCIDNSQTLASRNENDSLVHVCNTGFLLLTGYFCSTLIPCDNPWPISWIHPPYPQRIWNQSPKNR